MKKVGQDDIKSMMIRAGWIHPLDNPIMYVMDRGFELCDEKQIWDIVKQDDTDKKPYVPEEWDCDDFAFSLNAAVNEEYPGRCHGVLIVETQRDPNNPGRRGYHAVFFYCTDGYRIEAIEPQNDSPFVGPFKVRAVIAY